jgi:hypothetical protein
VPDGGASPPEDIGYVSDCLGEERATHASCAFRKVLDGTVERAVARAYVLIQTEVGRTAGVATEVNAIHGVSSSEAVTGPFDVIAAVEAANIDDLGKMIVSRIQGRERGRAHADLSRDPHLNGNLRISSAPPVFTALRGFACRSRTDAVRTTKLESPGTRQPLVPPAGCEPATHGLGNRCSIH